MRICKTYVLYIVAYFSFQLSFAQLQFNVQENFNQVEFDSHIEVLTTVNDISADQIINRPLTDWKANEVFYGFSESFYWLRFTLNNSSSTDKELYFVIDNPHLNFVDLYELNGTNLQLKYQSGLYRPFDIRPVASENIVFPIRIESNIAKTYYVKIDKRNTSVSFPSYLMHKASFIKSSNKRNLISGLLYGCFVIVILYSFLSYVYLRKLLYLWYSIYVSLSLFYLLASMGYGFQYIYPKAIVFASYARIVSMILAIVFFIKFSQALLQTKKYSFKVHRLMDAIILSGLLLIIGYMIVPNFYNAHRNTIINFVYVWVFAFQLSCVLALISTYRKQKTKVILYILAFSSLFVAAIIGILFDYGWFPKLQFYISPLTIGFLLEILILSIVLLKEMRSIYKEKLDLSIKIAKKSQEVSRAYIKGVEIEKVRISAELHDDIGSQLANFIRHETHNKTLNEKSSEKLQEIINALRRISHRLSPNKGHLFSFREQIENLIEETFVDGTMVCDFQFLASNIELQEDQKMNVYRILQELLNNIVKHSKATLVDLQLVDVDEFLVVTVEDNGIGFDLKSNTKGVGLANINRRVDFLNGRFEVSSVINKGTFIVLSIPLQYD
ncbi:MAG: ATP-binding protein [Winogradskyella sp.]|nr:ATP-binding protein [Winogradskyella sp.]